MRKSLVNLIRTSVLAVALLGGVLAVSSPVEACPNCKGTMSEDSESEAAKLGKGYSWSVLVMLGIPGLLVAGMGSAAYFFIRRSDMTVGVPTSDGSA